MEKVYLLNNIFSENGYGIDTFSYRLYNGLSKYNLKIEKVEINKFYDQFLKYIKPSLIRRDIQRKLVYNLNKNVIKNKNVHVLDPVILPCKYLKSPRKKIVTVHDFYIFNEKQMLERIKRFKRALHYLAYKHILSSRRTYSCLKDYDFVFANSEEVKQRLISGFGVNEDKINVSYYPLSDKFIPLGIRRKNDKKVIGFINNFNENKIEKLKKFIEIFKQVKNDNIEFQIYGKGFPFNDIIKDDERIRYLGFLPEEKIVETYNSFDVYLSTSTVEGFGLPIIQAKACKVPVLCYAGDLPEIAKRNTLIWNDENLSEIIKNREWEKVDVEKAYGDAEECRPDKVIPKIIEVYKKVFE